MQISLPHYFKREMTVEKTNIKIYGKIEHNKLTIFQIKVGENFTEGTCSVEYYKDVLQSGNLKFYNSDNKISLRVFNYAKDAVLNIIHRQSL